MYNQNLFDIQKNSIILNYGVLQHFDDKNEEINETPYLLHKAGSDTKTRVKISTDYYNIIKKYIQEEGFEILNNLDKILAAVLFLTFILYNFVIFNNIHYFTKIINSSKRIL